MKAVQTFAKLFPGGTNLNLAPETKLSTFRERIRDCFLVTNDAQGKAVQPPLWANFRECHKPQSDFTTELPSNLILLIPSLNGEFFENKDDHDSLIWILENQPRPLPSGGKREGTPYTQVTYITHFTMSTLRTFSTVVLLGQEWQQPKLSRAGHICTGLIPSPPVMPRGIGQRSFATPSYDWVFMVCFLHSDVCSGLKTVQSVITHTIYIRDRDHRHQRGERSVEPSDRLRFLQPQCRNTVNLLNAGGPDGQQVPGRIPRHPMGIGGLGLKARWNARHLTVDRSRVNDPPCKKFTSNPYAAPQFLLI
jgi:hypothetical protein